MVPKKAIRAKIIASSRKLDFLEIMLKIPITPTPMVMIKSSEITLSTICGPFTKRMKTKIIAKQRMGMTTNMRYFSKLILKFQVVFFQFYFSIVE